MFYDGMIKLLENPAAAQVEAFARGVLELKGPDAVDFLHRLCSQDVSGLPVGEARPATFLSAKGKLLATCRILRGADRVFVEAELGQLDLLQQTIDRSHFTEKLTMSRPEGWSCRAVVGRSVLGVSDVPAASLVMFNDGEGFVVADQRHRLQRVCWHGPAGLGVLPAAFKDLPVADPDWLELQRICAGEVRVGIDTDATTLVLEAGLEDHLSTTKGCYTGQEIVARIHTYGHVNRELRLVAIETGEAPAVGTVLVEPEDGEAVGRLLSSVTIAGVTMGLGYLAREFIVVGSQVKLGGSDGAGCVVLEFGPT